MSARIATVLAPLISGCNRPTTPVPPTPRWTLMPAFSSRSARKAEVSCSSNASSGLRCIVRLTESISFSSSAAFCLINCFRFSLLPIFVLRFMF